jgi:flagellar protein FliO/FliZ
MIELTVRLVASLAVVVGLLLVMMRLGARRFRPRAGAPLRIVHRQALSRTSSLAVVEVGTRVLVLGTTEHQINVLAELDEDELSDVTEHDDEVIDMAAVRRVGTHAERRTPSVAGASNGSLAGSVLSPQTWREALAAAKGRA